MNNLTEMYSAICAEVPLSGDRGTYPNLRLLAHLQRASKVVICGQALSHCVNYTTRDLLQHWQQAAGRDPADLILLTDCPAVSLLHLFFLLLIVIVHLRAGASSVRGFESAGEQFLSDMRLAGLTLLSSHEATQLLHPNLSPTPHPNLSSDKRRIPVQPDPTPTKTAPPAAPIPAAGRVTAGPDLEVLSQSLAEDWASESGLEEARELQELQRQLGSWLQGAGQAAEQQLSQAQLRLRRQAAAAIQSLSDRASMERRTLQGDISALQSELQRLRTREVHLEDRLSALTQRSSLLLLECSTSRRMLAASLSSSTARYKGGGGWTDGPASAGTVTSSLKAILAASVLREWRALAQKGRQRKERALRASAVLRAHRRKLALQRSFAAIGAAGSRDRQTRRLQQLKSDTDELIQQVWGSEAHLEKLLF